MFDLCFKMKNIVKCNSRQCLGCESETTFKPNATWKKKKGIRRTPLDLTIKKGMDMIYWCLPAWGVFLKYGILDLVHINPSQSHFLIFVNCGNYLVSFGLYIHLEIENWISKHKLILKKLGYIIFLLH